MQIPLIYALVSTFWILVSDVTALKWVEPSLAVGLPDALQRIGLLQALKGFTFVAFTSVMLSLLIRRFTRRYQKAREELIDSYDHAMRSWIRAMDLCHQETGNHTERVTRMALALARQLGITDSRTLKRIECGGILHDIGKLGIPDHILTKAGKLTDDEYAVIKQHPQLAYDILSGIPFLGDCLDIPYCHHERWDGLGYPRGLKGREIPYHVRLFSIVDVWDAIISPRVYKEPWPEEKVLQYIGEQAGQMFDPDITRVFLAHYEQIKHAAERHDPPLYAAGQEPVRPLFYPDASLTPPTRP